MRRPQQLIPSVALITLVLGAWGALGQQEASRTDPPVSGQAADEQKSADDGAFLTVGDEAPALDVAHWLKGREIRAFEPGRIYVVSFWATWCKYCQAEMPGLSSLQEAYDPYDVTFVSISDQKLQTVFDFLARRGWNDKINYAMATDPDKSTQREYMVAAALGEIPTTFIVGREGRIEWIGHPGRIDRVLRDLVDNTWDRHAFKERFEKKMQPAYARARHMRQMREAYKAEDWERLLQLFDEAIERVDDPGRLKVQKFLLMIGEMNSPAEGYAYGNRLVEESWDDPMMLNSLAWFVVDAESVKHRDLDFAMKAARRAVELTEGKSAAILDTLARVHYELGDLDSALKWQRRAVENLTEGDRFSDVVRDALRRYEREVRKREKPQ